MGCIPAIQSDIINERKTKYRKKTQSVLPSAPLPRNWHEFLRVDENKTRIISSSITAYYPDQRRWKRNHCNRWPRYSYVHHIKKTYALSSHHVKMRRLITFVHCVHAASKGHKLRTVDTDAVVPAIAS